MYIVNKISFACVMCHFVVNGAGIFNLGWAACDLATISTHHSTRLNLSKITSALFLNADKILYNVCKGAMT